MYRIARKFDRGLAVTVNQCDAVTDTWCVVCTCREIHKLISTKITIHENLDPRNLPLYGIVLFLLLLLYGCMPLCSVIVIYQPCAVVELHNRKTELLPKPTSR